MNRMPQIAIFASGSGSNAENIVQHFKKTRTAKVALRSAEEEGIFAIVFDGHRVGRSLQSHRNAIGHRARR